MKLAGYGRIAVRDIRICGEVMLHVMIPVITLRLTPGRRPHVENARRRGRALPLGFGDGAPFGHRLRECHECSLGCAECLKIDWIGWLGRGPAHPHLAGIHRLEFLLGPRKTFCRCLVTPASVGRVTEILGKYTDAM